MGIERLLQHQPMPTQVKSVDALDRQRIYDQRVLQDNLTRIFDVIADIPFLDGVLVEDVAVGTTETLVEHKLGRECTGKIIVVKGGVGDVYDTIKTTTADLSKYLPLVSSVAVTVDVWVF